MFEYSLKLEQSRAVPGIMVKLQILEQAQKVYDLLKRGWHCPVTGIRIASSMCPELLEDVVYVRGENHSKDRSITSRYFETSEEAKIYYNRIKYALEYFKQESGFGIKITDDNFWETS